MTISESIWLNATPGSVWRLVLSLEEWPRWNRSVADARWLGARGWKAGHRFAFSYLAPGGRLLGGGRISRVEPHRELRWRGRVFGFRVEFALEALPDGSGTRVVFGSHFRGLPARIASGEPISRRIGALQRDFLQSLRRAGEHIGGRVP